MAVYCSGETLHSFENGRLVFAQRRVSESLADNSPPLSVGLLVDECERVGRAMHHCHVPRRLLDVFPMSVDVCHVWNCQKDGFLATEPFVSYPGARYWCLPKVDWVDNERSFLKTGHWVSSKQQQCFHSCTLSCRSHLTVFLMAPPHVNVDVSLPCVPAGVEVGKFRKKWTRVLRQRVKVCQMDADGDELRAQ